MQSRSEGQLPATPGMPLTWVQETAGPSSDLVPQWLSITTGS